MHNFNNKKALQNDDFYYSTDGFIVFTENYHLKRGYCCKNNCKHCPYNYKKNDESKRGNKKRNSSNIPSMPNFLPVLAAHQSERKF